VVKNLVCISDLKSGALFHFHSHMHQFLMLHNQLLIDRRRPRFPHSPTGSPLVQPPNLPPYLPLASRVKQLRVINLQSQALILLATPLLLKTHIMKTYKSIAGLLAEWIVYLNDWTAADGDPSFPMKLVGRRSLIANY
jgi:hypothetical protein